MKRTFVLSFIFAVIFPVAYHGVFSPDMRNVKMYESYVDSEGKIQQRQKQQDMYPKSSGVYSQYWQFWGLKQGIIKWSKFSAFCYLMVTPFMIVLLFSIKKNKKY